MRCYNNLTDTSLQPNTDWRKCIQSKEYKTYLALIFHFSLRLHGLMLEYILYTPISEEVNKVAVFRSNCTFFMGNNTALKHEVFPSFGYNFNTQMQQEYLTTLLSPDPKRHHCIKDPVLVLPVLMIFATSHAHTLSNCNTIS